MAIAGTCAYKTLSKPLRKGKSCLLKGIAIGENQDRVDALARKYGLETIRDFIPNWTPAANRQWIIDMMQQGREIHDFGPDFDRRNNGGRPSPNYGMERCETKGYFNLIKRFMRNGKRNL